MNFARRTLTICACMLAAASGCRPRHAPIVYPTVHDSVVISVAAHGGIVPIGSLPIDSTAVFYIDGVRIDTSAWYHIGLIDPASIESISVLSGVSAAAHGYIGVDGVVDIRTNANIPWLPWPPPFPSGMTEIADSALRARIQQLTLGDVDEWLRSALTSAGYSEVTYYRVPSGFALVTRLERYGDDGTLLSSPDRWSLSVHPLENRSRFDVGAILRSLLRAPVGHFRSLVFIVSSESFYTKASVTFDEVVQWQSDGANRLPRAIAESPYNQNHRITSLVYEFTRTDVAVDPAVRVPGTLPAMTHLQSSGILNALLGTSR